MIHFDTSFAVDLMRESVAEQHMPARGMLASRLRRKARASSSVQAVLPVE